MTKRIAMMMLSTAMFLGLTTMTARLAAAQSQGDKMGSGDKMASQDNGNMAGDTASDKMGSPDKGKMASGTMGQDKTTGDKMNTKTAKAKKKSSKKDKTAANAKMTDKGAMDNNNKGAMDNGNNNKMDDSSKMSDQK